MKIQIIKHKYGSCIGVLHKVFQIHAVLRLRRINKEEIIILICFKECCIGHMNKHPVIQTGFPDVLYCLFCHLWIYFQRINRDIRPYHGHLHGRKPNCCSAFQDLHDLRMTSEIRQKIFHAGIHHYRHMFASCLLFQLIKPVVHRMFPVSTSFRYSSAISFRCQIVSFGVAGMSYFQFGKYRVR